MNGMEQSPLYKMMHPGSVAYWGASNNFMSMGSVQLSQLIAMGFEGPIYPVHPKENEIQGLKAYRNIADVPEVPDLAVLILPTNLVPQILEECGKAGIKRAVVVTAGFGEAGPEGQQLQGQIVDIARQYGITFVGPNCIGVVNTYHKVNTTFFPYDASPGFVGMASQSGSFVTQMFTHMKNFGLGFSQAFSVGNEAMTDITDCLEYLGKCPHTKVIIMYVEAIRRGRRFLEIAKEVSKTKPIVAYYVGGSTAGRQAALSHTGALAGPDELYDGIFKQCGIIRASTIEEVFDICCVLGRGPLPAGKRLAILTNSGGPGAAAADAAERCGLKIATFSDETVSRLQAIVPHTASVGNPVDLTFSRNPADYTTTLPSIILEDDGVDSLFMYFLMPSHRVRATFLAMVGDPEKAEAMAQDFIRSQADSVAELIRKYGKPVAGGAFANRSEPIVRELQDRGVAVLPSPERAVNALAALAKYAEYRKSLSSER
jgi:acetate---CoA ligase (ADP-forming) subunit alpha